MEERLRWSGSVRGIVYVRIERRLGGNGEASFRWARYLEGPVCWIRAPERADRRAFIKAVAAALTRLISFQPKAPCPGDPPEWLVEGITEELLAVGGPELIPQPGDISTKLGGSWSAVKGGLREWRLSDSWAAVALSIRERGLLSFKKLSFPAPEDLQGERGLHYGRCARLFLWELTRLPNGYRRLAAFIRALPWRLNWQVAFLETYRPLFQSYLDVEKWWALGAHRFLHSAGLGWVSAKTALERLRDALTITLEIRENSKAPPRRKRVPLREALTQLNPAQTRAVILDAARRLNALRAESPPQVAQLIARYRNALLGYLHAQSTAPSGPARNFASWQARLALRNTLSALDALDVARQALESRANANELAQAGAGR